jgi:uncharacterized cofD-like protein
MSKTKKLKKIVCIGGGTGISVLLSGLKNYPLDLTAIVTMFDSGGSSGKLRKELGILPVGDVRQSITSTATDVSGLTEFFNYREDGENMGNFLIVEEERKTGSLEKAIKKWEKKLGSKAHIIPITLEKADIVAVLKDGRRVKEEEKIINCPSVSKIGIKKLFLEPKVKTNPKALSAVKKADLILFAPGKFYTSIIPNLLVKGFPEAVRKSRGEKVFICNLMTQIGNTDGFGVEDFLTILEKYLGGNIIDYIVFNTGKLSKKQLKEVRKVFPGADFIKYGKDLLKRKNFIGADIIDRNIRKLDPADTLVKKANKRTAILHNSNKLAKIIIKLCRQ